ncbi:hypothetical protein BUE67_14965, partial [Corynebacterium diphtheriae]
PNYCGRVINKYGTFNDIVPPIINVDTFEEAQERRQSKPFIVGIYKDLVTRKFLKSWIKI